MTEIADRVERGAALLDEHDPDWWCEDADPAIDLVALDLLDAELCILGQRCPFEVLDQYDPSGTPESRYGAYMRHLRGPDDDDDHLYVWALDHGFHLRQRGPGHDFGPAEFPRSQMRGCPHIKRVGSSRRLFA